MNSSSIANSMPTMSYLPIEMLESVLSKLTIRELQVAQVVCKKWREIALKVLFIKLYGPKLSSAITDKHHFFVNRRDVYACTIEPTVEPTARKRLIRFRKTPKIQFLSEQKTATMLQHPLILDLSVKGKLPGNQLSEFAKTHPKLRKLSVTECEGVSLPHLLLVFKKLSDLRSVTLSGNGFFHPDLIKRIGKCEDLAQLTITDFSQSTRTDARAASWVRDLRERGVTVLITIPNKKVSPL